MEIIAHRGASYDAPENTLAASRLAWTQGAAAVECDVHLTADGRLAVIHDEDTRRTTGVSRSVTATGSRELQALDAGSWKHPRFTGERIPLLEDLLATVPEGKRIYIEIKGGPETVAALAAAVRSTGLAEAQVVVISFDLAAVREAKRALGAVETFWILERESDDGRRPIDDVIARGREAKIDGLDLERTWPVNAALVRKLRGAGLKLGIWTVDDAALARTLAAAGVDSITTNRPGWLRTQLR